MRNDNFGDWPGVACRVGYWLFLAGLSVITVVSLAGLAGYVWARWLA